MGRVSFFALLCPLVACSQSVVVAPGAVGGAPDPGMDVRDGGRADAGGADPGRPDAGRPDSGGPDPVMDMGTDPGAAAFCPRARPTVPGSCGGSLTEPPCFLAQMAAEAELGCLYHALDLIVRCVPGASTNLAGLDLLAPLRTIFAPTNAAMRAYLAQEAFDLDALQRRVADDASCRGATEAQVQSLTALFAALAYHIADGRFSEAELAAEPTMQLRSVVGQLQGGEGIALPLQAGGVALRYVDPDLAVRQARILRADVAVDVGRGDINTVLHTVDTVLPTPTVLDVAVLEGLDAFVDAVQRASPADDASGSAIPLVDLLRSLERDLTVFVPNDAAFATLGRLPGPNVLRDRLLFHGSDNDGPVNGGDAFLLWSMPERLETLAGTDVRIDIDASPPSVEGGSGTATGADIVQADLQGSNGVVHVIDRVLTPR